LRSFISSDVFFFFFFFFFLRPYIFYPYARFAPSLLCFFSIFFRISFQFDKVKIVSMQKKKET